MLAPQAQNCCRDPQLRARDSQQPPTEPFRIFDRLVPPEDRLLFRSAEAQDFPTSWTLTGRREVLEQMLLWMRRARESEESGFRIELTAHVRDQLELARQVGASEKDLRYLVESLIARPLKALQPFEDAGVISDAKLEDED